MHNEDGVKEMEKLYPSGLVFQGHDYFPSFCLHLSLTNQANVALTSALRLRILMTFSTLESPCNLTLMLHTLFLVVFVFNVPIIERVPNLDVLGLKTVSFLFFVHMARCLAISYSNI